MKQNVKNCMIRRNNFMSVFNYIKNNQLKRKRKKRLKKQ